MGLADRMTERAVAARNTANNRAWSGTGAIQPGESKYANTQPGSGGTKPVQQPYRDSSIGGTPMTFKQAIGGFADAVNQDWAANRGNRTPSGPSAQDTLAYNSFPPSGGRSSGYGGGGYGYGGGGGGGGGGGSAGATDAQKKAFQQVLAEMQADGSINEGYDAFEDRLNKAYDPSWIGEAYDPAWVDRAYDSGWIDKAYDPSWIDQAYDTGWIDDAYNTGWIDKAFDTGWIDSAYDDGRLNQIYDTAKGGVQDAAQGGMDRLAPIMQGLNDRAATARTGVNDAFAASDARLAALDAEYGGRASATTQGLNNVLGANDAGAVGATETPLDALMANARVGNERFRGVADVGMADRPAVYEALNADVSSGITRDEQGLLNKIAQQRAQSLYQNNVGRQTALGANQRGMQTALGQNQLGRATAMGQSQLGRATAMGQNQIGRQTALGENQRGRESTLGQLNMGRISATGQNNTALQTALGEAGLGRLTAEQERQMREDDLRLRMAELGIEIPGLTDV